MQPGRTSLGQSRPRTPCQKCYNYVAKSGKTENAAQKP